MTDAPLVTVDPADPAPPYEQVRRQVLDAVGGGRLVPGDRLPPVRALAAQLGLAPGTVARAYRELEQAGVVRTQGRGGTVVTASGDAAREEVARLAAGFARQVRALGVDGEDAVAMLRAALRRG
jgi:DNA-binding transcriptional regulator YhcF (GntR family)